MLFNAMFERKQRKQTNNEVRANQNEKKTKKIQLNPSDTR